MYGLVTLLLKIGLTEKEAQAYLVCLKVGTNPASIIAKHADLNRCTAYSVLESLMKKGLVYQIEKNGIRYFTAVEPHRLLGYLEEKQRDLAFYKNEISMRLQEFDSLKHPHQIIPKLKSYSGKSRINKLYKEALNEPYLLINAQAHNKTHPFFTHYAPIFLNERREIQIAIYSSDTVATLSLKKREDIKTLPHCMPLELVGQKKLFIIDAQEFYGVEIRHKRIIEAHQKQFLQRLKNKKRPPA